jgi:plasmid stabilization system protein ParE
MSVRELEAAVSNLSREELAAFRKWFVKFDAEAWDKEIEEDVAAGRFDAVIREVDEDIRAGRLADLPLPAKAIVLDAIQKLPDESTFNEIRERIEFIAGVRKGLEEIERGEVVPLDEVEIILSRAAETDLAEIVEYIARDNPAAAMRLGCELVTHTRTLEKHPRIGCVVPEFQIETLRELIHGSYRIVYQINDDKKLIEVARFWHAARGTPGVSG